MSLGGVHVGLERRMSSHPKSYSERGSLTILNVRVIGICLLCYNIHCVFMYNESNISTLLLMCIATVLALEKL